MLRKGEITTTQIVTIVLVLVGFGVLLIVFTMFPFGSTIDRETCHTSVILRATTPEIGGLQSHVPLKCATEKICFTNKKGPFNWEGRCEDDFHSSKGITKVNVKEVEQIEKIISTEVVDCWTMMGEGKVSLFSQWIANDYGFGKVYPTCVICSRIAFDDELNLKEGEDLDDIDILDYMKRHKVPGEEISYEKFIAGEGGKLSVGNLKIKELEIGEKKVDDVTFSTYKAEKAITPLEPGEDFDDEEYNELAVLFMQISAPTHGDSALNVGQAIFGTTVLSLFTAPVATIKAIGGIAKVGWWGAAAVAVGGVYQQYSVYKNRGITAGVCGDISTGKEARNGCSVVRTVNYDVSEIRKYCQVIEGIDY